MKRVWILMILMLVGCGGRSEGPIREVENAVLPGDTKPRSEVGDVAVVRETVGIPGTDGLEIWGGALLYGRGREATGGDFVAHAGK